jgi:hypothetical protein
LPARFRFDLSNTIAASSRRAASSPITAGNFSGVNLIAAIAARAVARSLAATAAIGAPTKRTIASSASSEMTAPTPAMARAGPRSSPMIFACATGERKIVPSSWPSWWMSTV